MDDLDRGVLNIIQDRFPIEERPYLVIAEEIGVSEEEVIERVRSLSERGIIRDPSPVFDLRKLGYCSTLVAINVASERVDEVTEIINRREEVTHNYLREGEPNMWFTVIAESEAARDQVLADIEAEAESGMIYRFPSTRMFRARVVFNFDEGNDA